MLMNSSGLIEKTWRAEMPDDFVVVDASLVLKTILPNPDRTRCQQILANLHATQLVVPAIWVYEVTSGISKAVHFGEITPDEGRKSLLYVLNLDLQIIQPNPAQSLEAFERTLQLHRAASYDSFYLVTAESLGAEFWTADHRLVNTLEARRPAWLHSIYDSV